jgi:hypothetical protein
MMNFGYYIAGNKNNRLNVNVGDLVKNQSGSTGGLFNVTSELSQGNSEPLVISVKGNFKSYDSTSLIYGFNNWYSYPFANRYQFSFLGDRILQLCWLI